MTTTSRLLIPALAISALALPACGASISFVLGEEEGSGVAETTSFDVGDFTGVDIEDAFEATVELADGATSVEVTVDDNFTDDLDVKVDDGVLKVDLDISSWRAEVRPTVVISVPSLDLVHGSGAARIDVDGDLTDPDIEIAASGASRIDVSVDTESLSVDASGASKVTVDGTTDSVTIDASGASEIEFDDLTADSAQVDASGASNVAIGEVGVVDGDLSGASNLSVPNDANVRVGTSGASNVNRS
ncbi:MAG: head GIN domain-containing protein [Actinomycetota bacterium]